MSLPALANHMAARGRNGDSMLVHMSPQEVQALQALAEKHGRTLTINPETGQPEAFSLKSLLPVLAGVALGPAGMGLTIGGLSSAATAGLLVGGTTALATGDISRGLMAGLGAYGGAGIGASIAGLGEAAVGNAATTGLAQFEGGIGQEAISQATLNEARNAAIQNAAKSEILSAGAKAAWDNPSSLVDSLGGWKGAAKTIGAAATPILADAMVPTTTKMPKLDSGSIRKFSFDPYGQTYTPLGIYPAEGYKGMADGGIVALASGGEFDWVGKGEPVVRMADGGVSDTDVANWFAANQGATDAQIAAAMQQYGVGADQVARVTGVAQPEVQQRYEQAIAPQIISGYSEGVAGPGGKTATMGSGTVGILNQLEAAGVSPQELTDWGVASWGTPALQHAYDVAGTVRDFTTDQGDLGWYNMMQEKGYTPLDIARATGLSADEVWTRYNAVKDQLAKQQTVTPGGTKLDTATTYDNGAYGNYGSGNVTGTDYRGNQVSIATPGDIITNPDGTRTVVPNIPGRPYGGFTGIEALKSAYTAGGGSLGQTNLFVPKTLAELNQRYQNTGGSQQAYDYLVGKGASMLKPVTPTGEIMKPYKEAVMGMPTDLATKKYIFNPATQQYRLNPDYKPLTYDAAGNRVIGASQNEIAANAANAANAEVTQSNFDYAAYLAANPDVQAELDKGVADFGTKDDLAAAAWNHYIKYGKAEGRQATVKVAGGGAVGMALGGLGALAAGGAARYNLGGYSDGGRLLRGPGDGVSDSIPATIGNKQPARLADGEFVVPARIVSELGNGSTEAGARKLYAMMDRVQKARGKTTGKGKVAANTSADKYLPA